MEQAATYNEQALISLHDLEFSKLKHINLTIKSGEIYSVIGKYDSGKNELLRCINYLNKPNYGRIIIDNQNLNSLLERDFGKLRRKIALITKNPQLLSNKNVFHNVAIPLELNDSPSKSDIAKIVEKVLHFTGIADQFFAYPNQLNMLQKQITSIARALVTHPKALLCDDITCYLDAKATHQIVNLLNTINKELGISIIIASNDIEVIKSLSHKIIVMDNGTIVEESSAYDIFANPKTEFSKELVKAATRQEMPWAYKKKLRFQATQNQHPIVRISFTCLLAIEQIFGQLIEGFQFKITIIQAYQEHIQYKPINVILAEIEASPENLHEYFTEAMEFLKKHELNIEVLGYVANSV